MPAPPAPSRGRILAFLMFLVATGGVLALIGGEIYVRAKTGYVTPDTLRRDSLDYEGSVFARHVLARKSKEADGTYASWRINAQGYRGEDFVIPKPPRKVRILFYGGSQVFDENPKGTDWPTRTGQILREQGLADVETLNLGIPGHASFDSTGRLFAEGHLFDPDIVVLLNAWNDMKHFSDPDPLLRQLKPYVWVNPRLHYWNFFDRFLCETSQLYVQLRDLYVKRQQRLGKEGKINDNTTPFKIHDNGLRQYRLNFATFADIAHTIGAKPVFMLQPRLPAPGNSDEEKKHISYHYLRIDHPTLLETFATTDRIIREVAAAKAALLLDTSGPMTGQGRYFLDHVHLSAEGSEALAQHVAQGMRPLVASIRVPRP